MMCLMASDGDGGRGHHLLLPSQQSSAVHLHQAQLFGLSNASSTFRG